MSAPKRKAPLKSAPRKAAKKARGGRPKKPPSPPTSPTSESEGQEEEDEEEEHLVTDDFPSEVTSKESEVFEAESAVPKKAAVQAKKRPDTLPDPKQKPPKRLADDEAETQRLREESRQLELAQRRIEAERAQLRAELKAKRARKKAEEEEAMRAEAIKKEAKEKEDERKRELRRQAELELRKEDEARVADLRKGNPGPSPDFYSADPAERKKLIKEWNQKVSDYQAELKRIAKEDKKEKEKKEARRPEVERILHESGSTAQAKRSVLS